MNLLFYEDSALPRFYPNALTRPLDDLRFGILTIGEKWRHVAKAKRSSRMLRPWLKGVFEDPTPDLSESWLWVNSRFVPFDALRTELLALQDGQGLMSGDVPIAVRLPGDATLRFYKQQAGYIDQFWSAFDVKHTPEDPIRYKHVDVNFRDISFSQTTAGLLLKHSWDLTHHNAEEIRRDIPRAGHQKTLAELGSQPFFSMRSDQVFLGKDVKLDVGIILDASQGPIYIGDHAHLMSGAMIRGPVSIGEHATIRMGAKIYEGTTAGPWCKLGGETSAVIFQSYSNKAHDGYIGNSLIGEWVNIGADTNNSNLKNNYTAVKVYNWESGELEDSGLQFCGLFLADHCKTAINSMLNSGTVCGVSSSVLTNTFPPKYIPSFGWVTDESIDVFALDKALETAAVMMGRRGMKMSPAYERMMRYLYSVRDGRR
jgi:UDP-N-acetylglucosamine diphosphorylase/glucosamine-1-phosphate N-acetyltransferase